MPTSVPEVIIALQGAHGFDPERIVGRVRVTSALKSDQSPLCYAEASSTFSTSRNTAGSSRFIVVDSVYCPLPRSPETFGLGSLLAFAKTCQGQYRISILCEVIQSCSAGTILFEIRLHG